MFSGKILKLTFTLNVQLHHLTTHTFLFGLSAIQTRTSERAEDVSLGQIVHHYLFIGIYCLFTLASFSESLNASRWSGKPE